MTTSDSSSSRGREAGASQVEGVLVEIFGEKYRIGGDPQQVQQVAAYVDAKMKEITAKNGRMPKAQVAMLAAMETAADLFKVMSERKVFTDRAHESVERLTKLVEDRATLVDADVTAATGAQSNRLGSDRAADRLLADRLMSGRLDSGRLASERLPAEEKTDRTREQIKSAT